jgi:hypothetical protein
VVVTAVISEAVRSGSVAVSEDAPRRVMSVMASAAVSKAPRPPTLGRGISAVLIVQQCIS